MSRASQYEQALVFEYLLALPYVDKERVDFSSRRLTHHASW
jgi:hypothetical protein